MTVDSRTFRNAMASFATGVTVVTAMGGDGRPVGVTVNAFSSLSLDPPMLLVCLGAKTRDLDVYAAGPFAVNVLKEDQKELSIRFATSGGDKWADTGFTSGLGGVPLIDGCLAHVQCKVADVHRTGDHHILVGLVEAVSSMPVGQPLVYFRSSYAHLGDNA